MPNHQIDRSIRHSLRFRNKTLKNTKNQNKTKVLHRTEHIAKQEANTHMRMILPPRLPLLRKTTSCNTTGHGCRSLYEEINKSSTPESAIPPQEEGEKQPETQTYRRKREVVEQSQRVGVESNVRLRFMSEA